jgi:hypothetical protein
MHTLSEVYNFVVNNSTSTESNHSLFSTSTPTATSSLSVSEIYATLANLVKKENIKTGESLLGVMGDYGVTDTRSDVPLLSSTLAPTSATGTPTGYTLDDIYNLIHSNATTSASAHLLTSLGSVSSTMYSINDIYNALTDTNFINPDFVRVGVTYLNKIGNYSPTNYGLDFGGTSYANAPENNLQNITINTWVKFSSLHSGWNGIIGHDNNNTGYSVAVNGTLQVYRWNNGGGSYQTYDTGFTPSLSTWYNIVLTYNSSTGDLITYVNGSQVHTSNDTSPTYFDGSAYRIGSYDINGSPMDGIVGEVSMWNRALSSSEITTIYNSGIGTRITPASGVGATGLVGLWQFDENTGTTAFDTSGNGNHGVLVSSPTYVAITSYVNSLASGLLNGLIDYYPFDTNAMDYSGNSNNATNNGAVMTTGKVGGAYDFNGSAYMVAPHLPNSTDMSISLWINPSNNDQMGLINQHNAGGDNDGEWAVYYFTHNINPDFYGSNSCTNTVYLNNVKYTQSDIDAGSVVPTVGQWNHLVFEYTGCGSGFNNNAVPFGIGFLQSASSPSYFYTGLIDELAVWNRSLSDSEVSYLYNGSNGRAIDTGVTPSFGLTDGLTAYYPLNSDVNDYSGNGHNGVPNGSTIAPTTGQVGGAYYFDGSSDYISVAGNADSAQSSVAFWVYENSQASNGDCAHADPLMRVNTAPDLASNGGQLCYYYGSSGWTTISGDAGSIPPSTWTYFVITRDNSSGDIKVYKNGSLTYENTPPGVYNTGLIPNLIGGFPPPDVGTYFNGNLDEVAVWNRVLTAGEVSQLYNGGSGHSLLP